MDKWLNELENEKDITILYACEGGSRAWGTSSEHSDQDIRFVFMQNNLHAYLSIKPSIDVIDISTPIDVHGWDLFKAFHLIRKSNPSIFEWAFSPIVYIDRNGFSDKLKDIVLKHYSPYALAYHYIHVCARNVKEVKSKQKIDDKNQKKLIQALRAILIGKFILEKPGIPNPFQITVYLDDSVDSLGNCYQYFIKKKQAGGLVSKEIWDKTIALLDLEKERLLEQTATLGKGADPLASLDKWIWDLLLGKYRDK